VLISAIYSSSSRGFLLGWVCFDGSSLYSGALTLEITSKEGNLHNLALCLVLEVSLCSGFSCVARASIYCSTARVSVLPRIA